MLGIRDKRSRNIKVGFKGPTLHTGPRRTRIGSAFCDTMGEFLYELCNAVLYKYGGYDKKYFKVGMWGDYIRVLRCTDDQVKCYTHQMIRIARTAMKRNQLLMFEVSIVDELDQPICTFAVQFRKNPDFHEGALWQNRESHHEFVRCLGKVIRNVQLTHLSAETKVLVATTSSRLRIRMQLDDTFKELAEELDLIPDSSLPQPWHSEFIPIADPITNLFNQLCFTAIVRNCPMVNEQDSRFEAYWH